MILRNLALLGSLALAGACHSPGGGDTARSDGPARPRGPRPPVELPDFYGIFRVVNGRSIELKAGTGGSKQELILPADVQFLVHAPNAAAVAAHLELRRRTWLRREIQIDRPILRREIRPPRVKDVGRWIVRDDVSAIEMLTAPVPGQAEMALRVPREGLEGGLHLLLGWPALEEPVVFSAGGADPADGPASGSGCVDVIVNTGTSDRDLLSGTTLGEFIPCDESDRRFGKTILGTLHRNGSSLVVLPRFAHESGSWREFQVYPVVPYESADGRDYDVREQEALARQQADEESIVSDVRTFHAHARGKLVARLTVNRVVKDLGWHAYTTIALEVEPDRSADLLGPLEGIVCLSQDVPQDFWSVAALSQESEAKLGQLALQVAARAPALFDDALRGMGTSAGEIERVGTGVRLDRLEVFDVQGDGLPEVSAVAIVDGTPCPVHVSLVGTWHPTAKLAAPQVCIARCELTEHWGDPRLEAFPVDVDGDGRAELLLGETWYGDSAAMSLARLDGTQLTALTPRRR